MAAEQYVDLVSTTLATTINNSTTTVVVASATGMPATGNFTLLITDGVNSELLHVTSRSTVTLTVAARGSWGTAANGFASGSTITLVLSASAFDAIRANMSAVGVYASLPASGMKSGDRYRCTDIQYDFIYNGSAWVPIFQDLSATLPLTSSWSWDNQGSSTISSSLGALQFFFAGSASGIRGYYRTAPATPYTVTIRAKQFPGSYLATNGVMDAFGIFFRDGTGKLVTLLIFHTATTGSWLTSKFTNSTSYSADYTNAFNTVIQNASTFLSYERDLLLRLTDNGTNIIFQRSFDGLTWVTLDTRSRTDWLASGPTQWGIAAYSTTAENGYLNVYDITIT